MPAHGARLHTGTHSPIFSTVSGLRSVSFLFLRGSARRPGEGSQATRGRGKRRPAWEPSGALCVVILAGGIAVVGAGERVAISTMVEIPERVTRKDGRSYHPTTPRSPLRNRVVAVAAGWHGRAGRPRLCSALPTSDLRSRRRRRLSRAGACGSSCSRSRTLEGCSSGVARQKSQPHRIPVSRPAPATMEFLWASSATAGGCRRWPSAMLA